jgi:hypothetical protein
MPRVLLLEITYERKGVGHLGLRKAMQLLPSLPRPDDSVQGMALANVEVRPKYNSFLWLWQEYTSRVSRPVKFKENSS